MFFFKSIVLFRSHITCHGLVEITRIDLSFFPHISFLEVDIFVFIFIFWDLVIRLFVILFYFSFFMWDYHKLQISQVNSGKL